MLALTLGFSLCAAAQGGRREGLGLAQIGPYLRPIPGGSVRVCGPTPVYVNGVCTNTVHIYKDVALTQEILPKGIIPVTPNGEFIYFATPGFFTEQVSGSGVNTVTYLNVEIGLAGSSGGCSPGSVPDTAVLTNHPAGTCFGTDDFTADLVNHQYNIGFGPSWVDDGISTVNQNISIGMFGEIVPNGGTVTDNTFISEAYEVDAQAGGLLLYNRMLGSYNVLDAGTGTLENNVIIGVSKEIHADSGLMEDNVFIGFAGLYNANSGQIVDVATLGSSEAINAGSGFVDDSVFVGFAGETTTTSGMFSEIFTFGSANTVITDSDDVSGLTIIGDNNSVRGEATACLVLGWNTNVPTPCDGLIDLTFGNNEMEISMNSVKVTYLTPSLCVATDSSDKLVSVACGLSGTLTVPQGGTGRATVAAGDLLCGNGTGTLALITPGTSAQVLTSNGAGVCGSFQTAGGTAATAVSGLTAAAGNNTISLGAFAQTWQANDGSSTNVHNIALTESAAATGTGNVLLFINTASTSTALPFEATANGNGVEVSTTGELIGVGTGTINFGILTNIPAVCSSNKVSLGYTSASVNDCLTLTTAYLPYTYTGNTTDLVTGTGTYTNGDALSVDSNGNVIDSAVAFANLSRNTVSGTTNALSKFSAAHTLTNSVISDNGTIVSSSESVDVTSNALVSEVANAGTTGTTVNKVAKLNGAPSTALIAATTDVSGVVGVVIGGAGTTGNAQIAVLGTASCVFDGATVAGDYVQISATSAGDCTDGGATIPSTGQVLGRVLSTHGGTGTYAMLLSGSGTGGGGGGSAATLQTNTSNNSSQSLLNFVNTSGATGIAFTNPSGGIESATIANVLGQGADVLTFTESNATLGDYPCYTGITPTTITNCHVGLNINRQSGTTYTIASSDRAVMISANNTLSQTYTLPAAGSAGFGNNYTTSISNISSGVVQITTSTSTFTGSGYVAASSIFLNAGQTVYIYSDNSNYLPVILSQPLAGTTGSLGGSLLTTGSCTSGNVTIAGVSTGMGIIVTPTTYPGDLIVWKGYVSATNTVTVKVCAISSATPTASTYNVRVQQ